MMIKNLARSGLSIAIGKTMQAYHHQSELIEKQKPGEFSIKIANTLEERDAAFQLAYQVYLEKGYINTNCHEKLIRQYDQDSQTVILIVQDKAKNVVGSATVVFDDSSNLPADKIYSDELKIIRKNNQKVAELSRLVISNTFRNSKEILVLLFNYVAIYITRVNICDGLVVEVNPRHKNFYKALLSFDEFGQEKPCPQVKNAVGNLLYLPIEKYKKMVQQNKLNLSSEKKERSLYPYFLKTEQENLVAFYLKKQTKPITAEEKIYFGFTDSGINQEVYV